MPPASLSTLAVMKPGPRTARMIMIRVLQVRQVIALLPFRWVGRTRRLASLRLNQFWRSELCLELVDEVRFGVDEVVELTGWGFEGGVGCGVGVGLDVVGIFG